MAEHWEKERGAWVLAHAGNSLNARRRGELLLRASRRRARDGSSAGDVAGIEAVTPSRLVRSIRREEGAANTIGWVIYTAIEYGLRAVIIGPAEVLGWAIYGLWWTQTERWGRLRAWPLVLLALLLGVGAWFASTRVALEPLYLVCFYYAAAQIVLAPLFTAVNTRLYGWSAAKAGTAQVRARGVELPKREKYEDADDTESPAQEINEEED